MVRTTVYAELLSWWLRDDDEVVRENERMPTDGFYPEVAQPLNTTRTDHLFDVGRPRPKSDPIMEILVRSTEATGSLDLSAQRRFGRAAEANSLRCDGIRRCARSRLR
jgi:hypothetical protein